MTKKTWMASAAVGAIVLGGLLWSLRDEAPEQAPVTASTTQPTGSPPAVASAAPASFELPASSAYMSDLGGDNQGKKRSPLDSMVQPTFRATSQGNLAMDQQTRFDVERIHSLYSRDEAMARLDALSADLPPQAQRDLKDLFQKYSQYEQAVAQAYPPGTGSDSIEDAKRQLKTMHDLRQQFFGPENAEAMYGMEEKTSAELLDLMAKQTDPNMSLADKAAQAQDAWKKAHQQPSTPAQP